MNHECLHKTVDRFLPIDYCHIIRNVYQGLLLRGDCIFANILFTNNVASRCILITQVSSPQQAHRPEAEAQRRVHHRSRSPVSPRLCQQIHRDNWRDTAATVASRVSECIASWWCSSQVSDNGNVRISCLGPFCFFLCYGSHIAL